MPVLNKILPHRVMCANRLTYPAHLILPEGASMSAPKFRLVTLAKYGMPEQHHDYYKPCEVYAVEGRNTYVIRKL